MDIKRVVRLPRRWRGTAGVALVTMLAVPSLALIWRNSRPVEVLGLAVAAAVGWAALGQIDGAALVPVMVALYWVALTRPRRIAMAAGLAGAAAMHLDDIDAATLISAIQSKIMHDNPVGFERNSS